MHATEDEGTRKRQKGRLELCQHKTTSPPARVCIRGSATGHRGAYTPSDANHKFQVLQHRCEEVGRPYNSILRATHLSPMILAKTEAGIQAKLDHFPKPLLAFLEQTVVATTPGDAIKRIQALVDVGFQYFLFGIADNDEETLNLLAQQVIPAIVA